MSKSNDVTNRPSALSSLPSTTTSSLSSYSAAPITHGDLHTSCAGCMQNWLAALSAPRPALSSPSSLDIFLVYLVLTSAVLRAHLTLGQPRDLMRRGVEDNKAESNQTLSSFNPKTIPNQQEKSTTTTRQSYGLSLTASKARRLWFLQRSQRGHSQSMPLDLEVVQIPKRQTTRRTWPPVTEGSILSQQQKFFTAWENRV